MENKENQTKQDEIRELKAQDILDKFDFIHNKYEEEIQEKGIYIDFLDGYFKVQKLENDELQDCIKLMAKDPEYGACKFIFLSIPELQNDALLKRFKTKDGAILVDRIFVGNDRKKTKVFYELINLNGIGEIGNDSVRLVKINEIKKKIENDLVYKTFSYYLNRGAYKLSELKEMYINNEDDFNFLIASMYINKKEDIDLATLSNSNFYTRKEV